MNERKQGRSQKAAAAKASLSERSARRIDKGELTPTPKPKRTHRTRKNLPGGCLGRGTGPSAGEGL